MEENSLVVRDIDISALTDDELTARLKEYNKTLGPIVQSTRPVYRKKLANAMREKMNGEILAPDTSINAPVSDIENSNVEKIEESVESTNEELKNADFSDDDEEEPYQPSVVNTSNSSKSTISYDSPLSLKKTSEDKSSFANIRQQ